MTVCYIISSKEMVTAMDKKLRKSESALITWFGKWSGSPCFMPSPSFKRNTGPSLIEDPKAQFSYENTNHRNTYVSVNSNWIHPPRATPGKFFLSERIPATRTFFLSNSLPRGKNWWSNFRGWGKIFPNSKKLFLKLAKTLKKLRKLRDSTNFLFGELNKTFIF